MTKKQCLKCNELKIESDFYKNQNRCKTCCIAASKAYQQANKEKFLAYQREYRRNNKEKIASYFYPCNGDFAIKKSQYNKNYYEKNKAKFAARDVRKETLRTQCTPSWADAKRVQAYYDVCSFFNKINGYIKYHVDHIVPIQGKKVSGLHVHTNLRVIPASENIRKKNHFEIQS